MGSDSLDSPRETAIEQLDALGVSAYAAETFVVLTELGEATAREVSAASDVPRTRVYDAVRELRDHGLVDVQHASPRRFHPVSTETASRHFERRYARRVNRLTESLDAVESGPSPEEQRGVWTVTGSDAVTGRVTEFVDGASDEVVFMTVGELMEERIAGRLRAAGDRGVDVRLAEMSDEIEERLYDDVPGAEPFESLWDWQDTPAGRLLMVDRDRTLVSVVLPGDSSDSGPRRTETAIWGSGEANGLVVVLRTVFAWELGGR